MAQTGNADRLHHLPQRTANASVEIDAGHIRLLEAVIDQAPELVRRREFLPAANWRRASPAQVQRLLQRLADASVPAPAWLAQALVVAGHSLDLRTLESADRAVALVSELNRSGFERSLRADQSNDLAERLDGSPLPPEIAVSLCKRLMDQGDERLAARIALSHWQTVPQVLGAARAALAAAQSQLPDVRVRVAGFSSTQRLAELLAPAFMSLGRHVIAECADFGAAIAALTAPAGAPQCLLVLLDLESYFVPDWRSEPGQAREHFGLRLEALAQAIETHARVHASQLLINTLPAPTIPTRGYIDAIDPLGMAAIVRQVNARLVELASAWQTIQLVDSDVALASVPPERRHDAKLWYFGRFAYSDEATRALASAFANAWFARAGSGVKVVALDFDNTLWGGVFGDDGVGRLRCGDDFPGNAFQAFQRECLRLKAQGFLLVGLSKNNPDALTIFSDHPGMVLRTDDFVATAVNWEPKAENIRRIARDLNLGLDSFAFFDDSAHERSAMRRLCPEVMVPEMPQDAALRPTWLRSLVRTWPASITNEDSKRTEFYQAEREGRVLKEAGASYDDYLAALGQKLIVEEVGPDTLARVVQLHARTNQFNLTTRRYSEVELTRLMAVRMSALLAAGTVSDRFGQHGLTIAAVATINGDVATIESFVMSCRVFARQIEQAFLGAFLDKLVALKANRVVASYIPTPKNAPSRDFYPSSGFVPSGNNGAADVWIWEVGNQPLPSSGFVEVAWRTT